MMWVTSAHSCVYQNMALPEHPGQGGLDFGGNHFIITHSDKKVSARRASTAQTLPRCHQHTGAAPAQSRVHPAAAAGSSSTSGDSWLLQTLSISETQSCWSFLPNLASLWVIEGNSPPTFSPGNSLQLRSSFTASAPSGEVYCNVQVLIYISVPLKQWQWLKKP